MESNELAARGGRAPRQLGRGRRVRAARRTRARDRGHEELREFWSRFESEGRQLRAGAYSITEEDDSVVVSGWVRTIDEGRLADTQSRWVYRFNDEGKVVSARVERA